MLLKRSYAGKILLKCKHIVLQDIVPILNHDSRQHESNENISTILKRSYIEMRLLKMLESIIGI